MIEQEIGLRERAYQIYYEAAEKLLRGEISSKEFAKEQAERYLQELEDSLTGLYGRKFFDQAIIPLVAGAERQKEPLSLIMLDLDDLKDINDKYGHLVGDRTLKALGETVKDVIRRQSDIGVRYGGEEVAIVLPGTETKGAIKVATGLINAIREKEVTTEKGGIKFTASIGIASFEKGMTPEELIGKADKALYRAKEKGKDRIEVYNKKPGE